MENVKRKTYIRIGEKTAFIKAMDKLKKNKLIISVIITIASLFVLYVILLNKFVMLLSSI